MSDRESLHAACLAEPADDVARLVYADYLRGDAGTKYAADLGRFLWAGVTLAGYRAADVDRDGPFFDAERELNATAPGVVLHQCHELFGWNRKLMGWDQSDTTAPDRCIVARILTGNTGRKRHARSASEYAIYERGMLCGLRMRLADWRACAVAVLRACPLERVEVIDVPGLTFRFMRETDPERWQLVGDLKLQAAGPLGTVHATGSKRIIEPWSIGSRSALIEYIYCAIDDTVELLRSEAGYRWPGPATSAGLYEQAWAGTGDTDPDEPQDDEDE